MSKDKLGKYSIRVQVVKNFDIDIVAHNMSDGCDKAKKIFESLTDEQRSEHLQSEFIETWCNGTIDTPKKYDSAE